MIRAALRAGLGLIAATTLVANTLVLAGSPFAAPYRDRTQAELSVVLDRTLRREMTPEHVTARINTSLANGEVDEASAILRLADGRGVTVAAPIRARVAEAEAQADGWSACLACAISTNDCPDLTRVAACNLPLELTPIGDVKAITRALTDYLSGTEIDRVDLALGVIGLSATLAILVSGGSSATVKLGASTLRVARKTGAVSARLMGEITTMASSALRLDRAGAVARGTAPMSDLIDATRAAALMAVASDMGRIADALPPGDALAMLRLANNAPELTRIARVAESAGSEARGSFAILGKARVMRLAQKLTDAALLALTLLAALAGQVFALILWLIRRALSGQARPARPRYAKH